MNHSHNTNPDEKKPQSGTPEQQNPNEPIPDKIVITDECGDTLWDEVLAQQPALSAIINKPTGAASDKGAADSQ